MFNSLFMYFTVVILLRNLVGMFYLTYYFRNKILGCRKYNVYTSLITKDGYHVRHIYFKPIRIHNTALHNNTVIVRLPVDIIFTM